MSGPPRLRGVPHFVRGQPGIYRGADRHARSQALCKAIHPGDPVYILVGFVLLPHKVPEMDGSVSAILLARSLVLAFGAKPIIVCPQDSVEAFKKCGNVVGLHVYEDLDTAMELPLSLGVVAFTKDKAKAPAQAKALADKILPAAVISVEACGGNAKGVYHNAVGKDVTALEAKSDVLWNELRARGVPNVAIGDLGNEIGMGTIADHIVKYVPFTGKGECQCGCGGGILSASTADNIITATCSDWGCCGLMAALAYLKQDMEILHREEMESEGMWVAALTFAAQILSALLA